MIAARNGVVPSVDVRGLPRLDLGMLTASLGDHRKDFVSLVFRAVVEEHDLDLQIVKDGKDFILVVTVLDGDLVVGDHRLPIAFDELPEELRLAVLGVYIDGLLAGYARWREREARWAARHGIAANDG